MLIQSLYAIAANTNANAYTGCNAGGIVVGGTCGSAEANPGSANITVNGSGLSGDGTAWICKINNTDLFNSHPIAYGSLCSYPVAGPNALKSAQSKSVPHGVSVTANPPKK